MDITRYRVKGEPWVTPDPQTDRFFWGMAGWEMEDLLQFSSIGQAYTTVEGSMYRLREKVKFPKEAAEAPEWTIRDQQACILHGLIGGRSLLWIEVQRLLRARGADWQEGEVAASLQWLQLTGRVKIVPGVEVPRAVSRWRCNRCGGGPSGIRSVQCARCGGACAVCESCAVLGASRACLPLIQALPIPQSQQAAIPTLRSPRLSPAQSDAAAGCLRWLDSSEEELLIWAVTGSGKTEMLFPSVRNVLEKGGNVLWTASRRDLVRELTTRLKKAFPDTPHVTLHGESEETWCDGRLFVATVQQAYRFYRRFSLVIVDEADAWPLSEDYRLQASLKRACTPEGKRVHVTATPPASWRRRVKKGHLPTVTLPARYHGNPLPVPRLTRVPGLWRKIERGRPLPVLEAFLEQARSTGGQVLLFIPRTGDSSRVIQWLKERLSPSLIRKCAAVSGRMEERTRLVEEFRRGERWLLLTTTILERGITVSRCHVGVLGADHPVFDTASLVQIAGRVGRSSDYMEGEVCFLARMRTEAQETAVRQIRSLNRLAGEQGYLKDQPGEGAW
ncbi:helicase-related protein [Salinithrix halophila]|uniref:Helicase-related protein n=1 Tax=Salinithrix halophila TaxID=1485204 RepID=A0ABV8JF72_9BACL